MTVSIHTLRADHIPTVAALLADAFADDAGMQAICGYRPEEQYRHCLNTWFVATLRLQLITQEPAWLVILDNQIVGAALLTHRRTRVSLRGWLGWLVAVGQQCGWSVVWKTAQHEQQRTKYRPAATHAVLEFIAVHREYRGQGYAGLLLDTVQQWSKIQPGIAGIWLETTRLANRAFFEQAGYIITGQMPFEGGESSFLFRAKHKEPDHAPARQAR